VGHIPCARAKPGLATIRLGDQRQQFALAATDGRIRGVDRLNQLLVRMEIVPAHARTNRSGGGTKEDYIEHTFACQRPRAPGVVGQSVSRSLTRPRPGAPDRKEWPGCWTSVEPWWLPKD
jgi:hypothetical protein